MESLPAGIIQAPKPPRYICWSFMLQGASSYCKSRGLAELRFREAPAGPARLWSGYRTRAPAGWPEAADAPCFGGRTKKVKTALPIMMNAMM